MTGSIDRVFVTGGAGFIGSNLIHRLLHDHADVPDSCCADHSDRPTHDEPWGVEILNVDKLTYAGNLENLDGVRDHPAHDLAQVDICDADAIDNLVSGFEPDAIIHLAAESHVDRSIEDGSAFVRTNVDGTQVLLDAARRHDVPRFLHVSTDEVYGSFEEGSASEADPYNPSSPYSASKAGSDLLCLAHHRTYGTPVTITRCTNNYGPRQHPEKLLPKVITNALEDRPIPVYGDGTNVRDWIYVQDHCAALERALVDGNDGEIYNVGGGNKVSNVDLVEQVLDLLGKPSSLIEFVEDRQGHDFRYSVDDRKMRGLGWAPGISFDQGLRWTVEWYRERLEDTA